MADNGKASGDSSHTVPSIEDVKAKMAEIRRVSVTEAKPGSGKARNHVEQIDAQMGNQLAQGVYIAKVIKHLRSLIKSAGEGFNNMSDEAILDFIGEEGFRTAYQMELKYWEVLGRIAKAQVAEVEAAAQLPEARELSERERLSDEMNRLMLRNAPGDKEKVQDIQKRMLELMD